jgi:hypothetical protein
VDLIEAYYAVARHLQEQADLKARTADMLGKMADAMSEERMRQKQPDTSA